MPYYRKCTSIWRLINVKLNELIVDARRGLLAPLPLGAPLGVFHNIFCLCTLSRSAPLAQRQSLWYVRLAYSFFCRYLWVSTNPVPLRTTAKTRHISLNMMLLAITLYFLPSALRRSKYLRISESAFSTARTVVRSSVFKSCLPILLVCVPLLMLVPDTTANGATQMCDA